jgi:hypothetical protein
MKPNSNDLLGLSLAPWKLWIAIGETARASNNVISKRSAIINHAMRSPFTADTKELGRMVPEKLSAFALSGRSLVGDVVKIQELVMAQAKDVMRISLLAKPPTISDVERMSTRAITIASVMTHAAMHALGPVHAAATSNQRRLA